MSPARPPKPPALFADADEINPLKLLLDLHDHALGRTAGRGRENALAELELSAAVVSWWTRWQPSMIHAAFRAGADLTDVADATGVDASDVIQRWRRWVDVQMRLDIGGRPSVDPAEVRGVERRWVRGGTMTPTRLARDVSTVAVAGIAVVVAKGRGQQSQRLRLPVGFVDGHPPAGTVRLASAAMSEGIRDPCNISRGPPCSHSVKVSPFPPDGSGFEAFVRQSAAGLLRLGNILTLDRTAAEDLAQETLIRVGLAWPRLRSDGNPVGYAQRTMTNLFLNERRRRRPTPTDKVPEIAREDSALAAVDSTAAVRQILASLPPKQRAVIALRYLADLPDDEIGRLLDCTPATVRSQLSRGLSSLRATMTAEG